MELTAAEGKAAMLAEQLPGIVTLAGDPDWDEARLSFNLLVDQRPVAVVRPRSAEEAAAAVNAIRDAGLRVSAQGSSHNIELLGPLADTVIVRLDRMKGVEIDPEARSARVEAGARWWDVTPKAAEHGLAAMHGSSPEVNVVGYALGGGLSWMCRNRGMLAHHVTGFDVVTADGRLVHASADSEPDLFWALRGGGGSFGLVTAIEFDLFPVESFYAGVMFFEFERAAEVLKAWHEWVPSAPEEMMSVGRLMQFPPLEIIPEPVRGKSFTLLQFIYAGPESEGAELVAPLRELGPQMDTVASVPPDGLGELHMDPVDPVPYLSDHMLLGDFPAETLDELDAAAGAGSGSALLSVELRALGGALGRPAADCGALASLNGSYLMFAVGAVMAPEMAEAVKTSLEKVNGVFSPYDAGRYFSFTEQPVDLEMIFPAETVARMREVKAAYDPNGLFRANHSVEPG